MLRDILADLRCPCGACSYDHFTRLRIQEMYRGLDWVVKCLRCGAVFILPVFRWGVRS